MPEPTYQENQYYSTEDKLYNLKQEREQCKFLSFLRGDSLRKIEKFLIIEIIKALSYYTYSDIKITDYFSNS